METKTFKLRETTIPQMFKQIGETEIMMTLNDGTKQAFNIRMDEDERTHACDATDPFGVFFMTIASIMSKDELKPKDSGKAALVFNDYKGVGEMLFACIAEYVEDGDDGNWYYSFSFNPDDIKGIKNENIFTFGNLEKVAPYAQTFNESFLELHSKRVPDIEIINATTLTIIKCLDNWLDSAAVENEIVELVIDDVLNYSTDRTTEEHNAAMVAFANLSVVVEKGIKIKSGQFGEELKAIAKGNGDSI